MALNAYLKLVGQSQGEIKGSVTQKGRDGTILVHAVSHEITSPRDGASGQATGKRMHKPIVITKEVDKSSPLLYNALTANEKLKEWELKFWRPSVRNTAGVGREQQYYTIMLQNANITGIRMVMANNLDPSVQSYPVYEEVSFTYQRIEWIWTDGGITSADDLISSGT